MKEGKKAIVFAGGGSKGAYQLGAWKALNELGETFDIATGTSIGSINAAFYVQNDFSEAEKMWNEITAGDIMENGINFDVSLDSIISQRDNLIPFIKNYINTKSVDNTPFLSAVQRYFSPERFFGSPVDFALITVNYKGFGPHEVSHCEITKQQMERDPENAWKWIAASSSCYPVFPPMEIDGQQYIDGGYYDNIPVASAFRLGASSVVVVDLNTDNNHEGYLRHPRVTYIRPSKELGSFLNFDRSVLTRSQRLGYNDTMKAFGRYYGFRYTLIPDERCEEYLEEATERFISILCEMEASFDFSSKVKYQRVNKLAGCTTALGEYCNKNRPSEKEIFISALEILLIALLFDDEKEYGLGELLYTLKTEVDRLYPLLEFDHASSFEKVKQFIKDFSGTKGPEVKKHDEDRIMIILTSVIRALQHAFFEL